MGILGAIYSGQSGLLKGVTSFSQRAQRISQLTENQGQNLAEDTAGMIVDKAQVTANARSLSISADLFQELSHLGSSRKAAK
jgi:hypothetical protein